MKNFLFKIAILYWLQWSRFVQWVQIKINEDRYCKQFNVDYQTKNPEADPIESWKHYTNRMQWRSDPWYHLWDAMNAPIETVVEKNGDCEDFARLAYSFFKEYMCCNNGIYRFKGFYVLNFGLAQGGHVLGVWENTKGNHFFITDNTLAYFSDIIPYRWQHRKIPRIAVIRFNDKGNMYLDRIIKDEVVR